MGRSVLADPRVDQVEILLPRLVVVCDLRQEASPASALRASPSPGSTHRGGAQVARSRDASRLPSGSSPLLAKRLTAERVSAETVRGKDREGLPLAAFATRRDESHARLRRTRLARARLGS